MNEETLKKPNKTLTLIVLHVGVLISSLGGICSKYASAEPFLSPRWILLYGLLLCAMMIYAVMWQQVLKRMSLVTAYLNRSVMLLWSMLWGIVIFGDRLTYNMILGVVVVLAGVCVMVRADES